MRVLAGRTQMVLLGVVSSRASQGVPRHRPGPVPLLGPGPPARLRCGGSDGRRGAAGGTWRQRPRGAARKPPGASLRRPRLYGTRSQGPSPPLQREEPRPQRRRCREVKTSEFYRYSRQLRHEVDQAMNYFHSVHQQPLMEMKSNKIRSAKPQTAVFRGMIGHSMVNSKILLLHKPRVWWELEGPQVPLRPDCLAIVNNFVFLLGGEELGPDGEFHASSKVFRYDPRQNTWLRMADMSVPRSEFAVGVIGRYVYAVAGRTRDETFYSTERYDITEDKWEFVDPYPVNKYGHEGTVLGNKLYITGGITSSSTSKQVCVFDPSKEGTVEQRTRRTQVVTNCWENKCKMNYARCFHKMISYNGKLYVFGGVCVILRASFESQGCPSTEVYDPDTDQWTILASMPIGRSGHGVAVLDKQIMVLGGLCYNGHYSDSILTFDPEENKWKEDEYPRMPCKLDGLQVCSLHFPEYVLEHVRRCS
ncbi:kelch-like protein 15 isoform 3-T8 [Geothlypis trichas]